MNKFTALGEIVLQPDGNGYDVNKWHKKPVPHGIIPDVMTVCFWLVRSPLPPLPHLPKTQEQLDVEAYQAWISSHTAITTSSAFRAALAWERAQREGKK